MKKLKKIYNIILTIIFLIPLVAYSQTYPTADQKRNLEEMIKRGNTSRGAYEKAAQENIKASDVNEAKATREAMNKKKEELQANRDSIIQAVDSLYDTGIPSASHGRIKYDPNCKGEGRTTWKCDILICEGAFTDPDWVASTKIHEWEHDKQKAGGWGARCTAEDAQEEMDAYNAELKADNGNKIKLSEAQKKELQKRKKEWQDKRDAAMAVVPEAGGKEKYGFVPGQEVIIPLTITNYSHNPRLGTCVIEDDFGWPIIPNTLHLNLRPDQDTSVMVMAFIPPLTNIGTINELFFNVYSEGDTSSDFFFINVVSNIKILPFDPVYSFRGELLNLHVTVQNIGLLPDSFKVHISDPFGWTLPPAYFEVNLMPYQQVILPFPVQVPFALHPYTTNLICINAVSKTDTNYFAKSDFPIVVKELDVGLLVIMSPFGSKQVGSVDIPKAVVYNYGHIDSFFDVFFEIPQLGYRDSVHISGLSPNTSIPIEFAALVLASTGEMTNLCYTYVPSDGMNSNDTLRSSFSVQQKGITVAGGWNMISVPCVVPDPRKEILFPTSTSNAFTYIYPTGYEAKDSLNNGEGYWLKFNEGQQIGMVGALILSDTFNVVQGWNMIGSISADIPTAAIVQNPPNIIASNYYSYKSGYKIAETIEVGNGYWIKAKVTGGELILSTEMLLKLPKYQSINDILAVFNTLNIKDSYGNEQVLYFGVNDDAVSKTVDFELPPPAPSGIFDVRFESNKMLEIHNKELEKPIDFPILLNGVEPPLSISWKVAKSKSFVYRLCSYDDSKLTINMLLKDKGSIKVNGLRTNKLLLKVETKFIPTEFALYQNYPNPFNPSTKIVFDLPFASKVDLKIYNILGQEVVTMCDKLEFEEGRQEVEFSANKLASGVYFYRINAEFDNKSFTSVKKMLYMK